METKELIKSIRNIERMVTHNITEYVDSRIAMILIGLDNVRDLKALNDMGVLPRYPRKGAFKYKKSECYKVAELLDNKQVILTNKK